MKTSTTYEWAAEKIDESGDIIEASYWDTRREAETMRDRGFTEIALCRRVHDPVDGDEIERQYAYLLEDGEMPDFFDAGARVPARFR